MIKIKNLSEKYLEKASILANSVFRDEPILPVDAFEASLNQEKLEELNKGEKNKILSLEYFLAVDETERVIGTAGLYSMEEDEKEAYWLGWYCVVPEFRRKGIGGKLLDFTIRKARERGKKFLRLYTSTSPKEKAAQRVYDTRGFRNIRRDSKYVYKELPL